MSPVLILSIILVSVAVSAIITVAAAISYADSERRKRIHWQDECNRIQQTLRTRIVLAGDQEATPCA